MILWMVRTAAFARFTLQEYLRSWRFLAELLAVVAIVWVFFWPRGAGGLDATQFFTLGGFFVLAQTAYSTAVMMGLGQRPQGYVVLARTLGRGGYFVGLYLAAAWVTVATYLSLTLAVVLTYALKGNPVGPPPDQWLLGTLPLMLDAAIVSAFAALLTPLVTTVWQRLLALGVLVIALVPDLPLMGDQGLARVAESVHQAFGLVLLPVLSGFQLAARREYGSATAWLLLSQLLLLSVLLGLAILLFRRREIILV